MRVINRSAIVRPDRGTIGDNLTTILRTFFALLAVATLLCSTAQAHKPSDSYIRFHNNAGHMNAEWDIALKDLELLVGLDSDQNGDITWGELRNKRYEIATHALEHLQVTADGNDCAFEVVDLMVNRHSDGSYAVLVMESDCPSGAAVVEIHYSLLFDADPTHRGLVLFDHGDNVSTHILSPDTPSVQIRAGEHGLWQSFVQYVREGVWHIWIGFDHILFLMSLLLPAVLIHEERKWIPVEKFRPACHAVLKIVTVFTFAHSITLWLAVMEYASLPSQWIEATIAFSIIVTALHNLYPLLPLSGWAIAFFFGLVHGFGFANVLVDLGLSDTSLAVSLFGFNVGVELGQIAIVLVFLPIAFLLRETAFYRWVVLRAGSVLIAVIAAIWMVERIGNVEIIGI